METVKKHLPTFLVVVAAIFFAGWASQKWSDYQNKPAA